MEYDSNKAPKAKLKRMLIRIGIALAVVLLLTLIVYIAVNIFLDSIERIDPKQVYGSNDPVIAFEQDEPVEKTPVSAQAEELFVGKDIVNILLAGQDRRAWETEGPQRTDAMILCTVNMKDKTITITSFLCDLWVYIPDLYNQRLNMPYKLGGFPLLNETLEYNFGVRSDYNIEIDFSGFMKAIDAIGGVEIELTAAEAAYLNKRGNWGVVTDPKWQLQSGSNLLNGSQALAYTRISQLGTDFARTNRQRTVLTALIEKMETIGSADLFDLSREILPLISTDMTDNEIIELLLHLFPLLSDLEIRTQNIPMSGQYSYEKKGEADVLVMNKEQLEINKKLLKDTISGQ